MSGIEGGWSQYSSTPGSCSISYTKGSSTRWLSNWMVVPILRLGYRPETFRQPPPTRRVGLRDRTAVIVVRVVSVNPSRAHQPRKSASLSTCPPQPERQRRRWLLSDVRTALVL